MFWKSRILTFWPFYRLIWESFPIKKWLGRVGSGYIWDIFMARWATVCAGPIRKEFEKMLPIVRYCQLRMSAVILIAVDTLSNTIDSEKIKTNWLMTQSGMVTNYDAGHVVKFVLTIARLAKCWQISIFAMPVAFAWKYQYTGKYREILANMISNPGIFTLNI